FDKWWKNPETEVHHFIGKDITYFHTLFWPAMLKTAGFNLPEKVHIHGFLSVGGEKMAKSKGTFIKASTYLNHLDPACLRYYYASKLGPKLDDLDLNLEEFIQKVNSDLVGKVVNLASRSAKFVAKTGLSETYPDDGGLFEYAASRSGTIAAAYESCDYNGAMRDILALADRANKYVEDQKPWELRKDESRQQELQDICTIALNLFRQIIVYLTPVLPKLSEQTGELLNDPLTNWDQIQTPLTGTPVNKFQHLFKRIEEKQVQAMTDEVKEEAAAASSEEAASQWKDSIDALEQEPMTEECTIDDFVKVDLRVARIVAASLVPDADKLLQLTLSLGGNERRNVFAGIKSAYNPEELVGRLVICCANLKPRKMRFGISEGMVLASGPGGKDVFLLTPDEGAVPGQRVH
ncbi:MAG: methionine--tRNA ligase subunit beta, partial [Gimesia sp.]